MSSTHVYRCWGNQLIWAASPSSDCADVWNRCKLLLIARHLFAFVASWGECVCTKLQIYKCYMLWPCFESQVVDLMLSHFNNGRVGFDHLLCCSKRSRWQWVQCPFKWWASGNHPRPVLLWRLVGLPQLCAWRSVSLQEWWCAKDWWQASSFWPFALHVCIPQWRIGLEA